MADLRNTQYSTTAQNAMLNALTALLNTGYIKIYDGTQPANGNTAVTTQNLLATLRFGVTAFAVASAGSAVANAITSATSGVITGTATWARLLQSDGTTVVMDVNVGSSSDANTNNMEFTSNSFVAGAQIDLTSVTLSINAAGV